MDFTSLLAQLPTSSAPTRFPLQQHSGELCHIPAQLPAFVPPNVSPRMDLDNPTEPTVIIISAAGAVGKTTLAREIAYASHAPFWDLALTGPVGQHTLNGMLVSAYGTQALGDVYAALAGGELLLVIDALDEARIKVTESAFEAFIADIAALAKTSGSVRFVLLGRTQIAESTWMLLDDAEVSAALYVIEPFTSEQAIQYIERRILSLGGPAAARMQDHRVPFTEARDLIFEHLRTAIRGTPNASEDVPVSAAQEFIGYAPVLDAISVLLAGETNYVELTARLSSELGAMQASGEHAHTALLRRVVERILSREHEEKLVRNLKPVLQTTAQRVGWSDWDSLYLPDEQCIRLIATLIGRPVTWKSELPRELATQYEEQIQSWLQEHPFLRDGRVAANVVFESYLYARALHDDTADLRDDVERRVGTREYRPSRLLADFYLLFNEEAHCKEVPPIHVGILYESLLSAETNTFRVRLSLEGTDPEDDEISVAGTTEGEFELFYVAGRGEQERVLGVRTFQTPMQPQDEVQFVRQLRDASIIVPCAVLLGTGGTDFEIGPRVQVRCRELRLFADAVVVEGDTRRPASGGESDTAVVLEATRFSGTVTQRAVVRGEFRVRWPGADAYPWTEWHDHVSADVSREGPLAEVYRRFRRIVMTLRSHGKGSLARLRDKIEHQRVLQGPVGERLLQRLIDDGVLSLKGQFYHWVPETANMRVGTSWQDLRGGVASARLTGYLRDFISGNQDLFDA